jgi:hypothetical protein
MVKRRGKRSMAAPAKGLHNIVATKAAPVINDRSKALCVCRNSQTPKPKLTIRAALTDKICPAHRIE